jgi:hypothetical protein
MYILKFTINISLIYQTTITSFHRYPYSIPPKDAFVIQVIVDKPQASTKHRKVYHRVFCYHP